MFKRLPHQVRDLLWRFHLKRVVIHNADAHLLILDAAANGLEIHPPRTAGLESDDVGIHSIERLDGRRVAWLRAEQPLRTGITPAGVAPDLRLCAQSSHCSVKYFQHEIGIENVVHETFCGKKMNLRLFDLDHLAAGVSKL